MSHGRDGYGPARNNIIIRAESQIKEAVLEVETTSVLDRMSFAGTEEL